MIEVVLTSDREGIRSVRISGHSQSADKGEDLICAAVSAIAFGTCNALYELGSDAECSVGDNRIEIRNCGSDELTQTILKTAVVQLKTVEEGNTQFLNIKENGGVKQ